MALRDEIAPKLNRMQELQDWMDSQPNKDEWYEIFRDISFSNKGIAKLLTKHGFKCDHNHVYRLRVKHGIV